MLFLRVVPLVILFLSLAARATAEPVVLTESVTLEPRTLRLDSPDFETPAYVIRGEDLVIDFGGAMLVGSDDPTPPDAFTGLGVKVEGKNITLRNLKVRGYKVGLLARGVDGLTLEDCDFSYNYRRRLLSDPWKEDAADWMSYHHNEADEWLRYGAAVYLRDCDDFTIKGLEIHGGQNGVMLTGCDDGVIHSSRITFNSGIGIGLYRSTKNRITSNRLDFNVRGHSEGVYNRGQDSAAILVYEQSSDNIIDRNIATHSGDGLFLWAGQSTLDAGEGGCNDNLIQENDFSYAPTNGIEVTFSRNFITGNKLHGCWHGIWGGYSYDTLIAGNDFAQNEEAINIEHGQDNPIIMNGFAGDGTGILLHERGTPDDWGYGKTRNTSSTGYLIAGNSFTDVGTALRITDTTDVRVFDNTFEDVVTVLQIDENVAIVEADAAAILDDLKAKMEDLKPEPLEGAAVPPGLAPDGLKRDAIRVTEWGPYDYRRPILWPEVAADPSGMTILAIPPFGVEGTWEIDTEGAEVEDLADGRKRVKLPTPEGKLVDVELTATWTGEGETVDEFGRIVPAGQPITLTYRRFVAPIDWQVKFFPWDDATDPRTQADEFATVLAGEPVATDETTTLDYRGHGAWAKDAPTDRFATVAEGTFTSPAREYVLNITSDDGIRMRLDGKIIHEDWTYHPPRTEQIRVSLDGEHRLTVEHFEIDGYAQLRVELRPEE